MDIIKMSSPSKNSSLLTFSIIVIFLAIVIHCASGSCPSMESWNNLKATVANLKRELNGHVSTSLNVESPTVLVSGMPKSCADLQRMGHIWSGFYSIMGDKQMQSVFCDFSKQTNEPKFQTMIGSVDVKSSPVYFYVQRSSSFSTKKVPIPFEVSRLNVGGAMDLATGVFTAPRSGTYFFSFNGIGNTGSWLYVGLYVNGNIIGKGYESTDYDTYVIQSTLHLNAGDKITLQIADGNGQVHDDGNHFTHFNGLLLQEDLSY